MSVIDQALPARQYQQDLNRKRPLSVQWGGRLLTEAESVKLRPPMNELQYVEMNLEHLRYEVFECDLGAAVSAEQLGAMLDLADELDWAVETYTKTAAAIRAIVPELWRYREEAE